jgi:hypothetical protein
MEGEEKEEKGLKSYQIYRASLYDPRVKRQIAKVFNLLKMSLDEAKIEARRWRDNKKIEIDEEIRRQNEPKKTDITPFEIKLDPYSGLSFLMIGSTRSGKSTALNWLMENHFFKSDEKFINVLFSNSYQAPVYDEYRENKKCSGSSFYHPKAIKEAYQINRGTNNKYRFNFILDDIVDKKFDKELIKLLTIYRNSRISTIICSQALTISNSIARGNINNVMLFKLNSDEAIEKVIKAYLVSYYPTKLKMIDKIKKYKEDTLDHCFYYIDNIAGTIIRSKINIKV